jgi:hypothetical protein
MPRRQSRKSYTRDDGCLMIEISPNVYVEESLAQGFELIR